MTTELSQIKLFYSSSRFASTESTSCKDLVVAPTRAVQQRLIQHEWPLIHLAD